MSSEIITKNDLKSILEEIVSIDGTDMASQEIEDFVDSLDITSIHAVNYVIEEDIISGWSYRKWSNGVIEAWYKYESSGTQTGASWVTNLYYYDQAISFPQGLFVSVQNVLVSSDSSQWTTYGTFSISSSGFTCRFTKPNNAAQYLSANIYVKGRWE